MAFALLGQSKPNWIENNSRNAQFPPSVFLTGFAQRVVEKGISSEIEQVKLDAQSDLTKQIRLMIKTKTQSNTFSQSVNGQYDERETFENKSSAETNAEVVGMKTEIYHDKSANSVYAFSYANKYELIGYYKSNLSVNIWQTESFMKAAQDLETNNEKSKARQQLENVNPIFPKIRYAQDLLTAIDVNASTEDLQQEKIESLYNQLVQMQARLAQAVYVYVESKEDLFGQKVDIVANKVKAELAKIGCSFVENVEQADFKLKIHISTRHSSNDSGMVFCYADTAVELYDNHKQKIVYGDEITQKGGSTTQDKAGRNAMNDVASKITEKLKNWIQ